MANAITAKLGVDIAPLKKGMGDAAQITKATSKRIADEQKQQAKDSAKSSETLRSSAKGLAGDLTSATSASDALSAGVSRVGENLKLGLVGGVAFAVLSSLVNKVGEATEQAEKFRDTMSGAVKPMGGAGGFSLSEIQGQLSGQLSAAGLLNDREKSPVKTALMSRVANVTNNVGAAMGLTDAVENDDPNRDGEKRGKLEEAAKATVERMAEKSRQLLEIEKARTVESEHAAELKQIELERSEKVGAANRLAMDAAKQGIVIDTKALSLAVNAEAALKVAEAMRKAAAAENEFGDATERNQQIADEAVKATTDKVEAQRRAIERLRQEEDKQLGYAKNAKSIEEKRGFERAASDARNQRLVAQAQFNAEQGLMSVGQRNAQQRQARRNAQRISRFGRIQDLNQKQRDRDEGVSDASKSERIRNAEADRRGMTGFQALEALKPREVKPPAFIAKPAMANPGGPNSDLAKAIGTGFDQSQLAKDIHKIATAPAKAA